MVKNRSDNLDNSLKVLKERIFIFLFKCSEESFIIVRGYFNDIVAQINRINGLSNDVINKLQEKQEYYRVEADFKLFRATMTDIED